MSQLGNLRPQINYRPDLPKSSTIDLGQDFVCCKQIQY